MLDLSLGGSIITAAGTDDRVAGLVYIAALVPDKTETSQGQQDKFPVTDVFQRVEIADGRACMRPSGAACFAGDLPEEEHKQLGLKVTYLPGQDKIWADVTISPDKFEQRRTLLG